MNLIEKNLDFLSSRLVVQTPEQYEQLKAGLFGYNYAHVLIGEGAGPHIFQDIKKFAVSEYNSIHFADKMGNKFHVKPAEKLAFADLHFSQGLLRMLPTDYTQYIIFHGDALSPTDVDAIMQWKQAERIQIEGESDVASQLERRAFNGLTNLKKIGIAVQFGYVIRPLLNKLSHIPVVEFYMGSFWDEEMVDEYASSQINLLSYRKEVLGRTLRYTKI